MATVLTCCQFHRGETSTQDHSDPDSAAIFEAAGVHCEGFGANGPVSLQSTNYTANLRQW